MKKKLRLVKTVRNPIGSILKLVLFAAFLHISGIMNYFKLYSKKYDNRRNYRCTRRCRYATIISSNTCSNSRIIKYNSRFCKRKYNS